MIETLCKMIETLYKTKTPKPSCATEQHFELALGKQTVGGQVGYFVRETHCWWNDAAQNTVRVQYTLSPRLGFATMQEAYERYNLQKIERARRGFVHSYTPRYEAGRRCKYVLIEVTQAARVQPAETQAGDARPRQS
jgi:hypothetical protein